jgi:alpha-glucuronidase
MTLQDIYIYPDMIDAKEVIIMRRAAEELKEAAQTILGISVTVHHIIGNVPYKSEKGVHLGIHKTFKKEDAYQLSELEGGIQINGSDGRGLIYGVFHLIRLLQLNKSLLNIDVHQEPDNPLRMLNHWDNMDGSIERGYSGDSFFFEDHKIIINDRTHMYARFLASMGINGTVINNVNVKNSATELITEKYYEELQSLMTIFDEYGIKLYLSLNYAAPMELSLIDTADPLDPQVISWWEKKIQEVYDHLPNLGGFVVKADSEGRVGPFDYGRNQAEGANMLGAAIKPYGGLIIWRCFVYNCQQDWRDRVTDRAKAGYDYFAPLDGLFGDNVILQIKNGPMDFPVREPVSPLFGGMKNTNQILEVQIAQEYTGQQRHVCYLIPMFKEILEFQTYGSFGQSRVSDVVSGRTYRKSTCGMATVCNTGNDINWTGHDLAGVNTYGFGRLSYDTSLTAEDIAKEWIQMTYGSDERIEKVLLEMLMQSRSIYEKYTSPLGVGWMVQPNHHYNPSVDGYEYSRWGTYHRADHLGIGVDRTLKGTGFTGQYNEPNASMYESLDTCPEELLLFFHHVAYTYRLSSGKTVIQHIYDTHFQGVEEVKDMIDSFKTLNGFLEETVYQRILSRLLEQQESATEWCDQINSYFKRKSGIEDEKNRIIY